MSSQQPSSANEKSPSSWRESNTRVLASIILVILALAGTTTPALAATDQPPSPLDAVLAVAPSVSNTAALVRSTNPKFAVEAQASDAKSVPVNVALPVSPTGKVKIESGVTVSIGLPFGNQADSAVVEHPGIVSYNNNNQSSTVTAVLSDGRVQISSVIQSPEAPTRFDYAVSLPSGSSLATHGSGAQIVNLEGDVIGVFQAPWAYDADGLAVPTRYQISGSTLTQIVDHNASFKYPVVADPTYVTTTYYWSRANVETMWRALNNINGVCHFLPLSFFVGLGCYPPASLSDAIASAHYQKKRIKAVYYNCGMNWCNYYKYYVIT